MGINTKIHTKRDLIERFNIIILRKIEPKSDEIFRILAEGPTAGHR